MAETSSKVQSSFMNNCANWESQNGKYMFSVSRIEEAENDKIGNFTFSDKEL